MGSSGIQCTCTVFTIGDLYKEIMFIMSWEIKIRQFDPGIINISGNAC